MKLLLVLAFIGLCFAAEEKKEKRGLELYESLGSFHEGDFKEHHEPEVLSLKTETKHVPVHTITKHVPYDVPHPVPYTVIKKVPYLVAKPYTVHVPRPYNVEVEVKVPVTVEKRYPVTVEKRYPVHVPVKVPVKVPKPYEVHVEKPYPVHVPVKVPVKVPVPVHINKPVYIKIDDHKDVVKGVEATEHQAALGAYDYESLSNWDKKIHEEGAGAVGVEGKDELHLGEWHEAKSDGESITSNIGGKDESRAEVHPNGATSYSFTVRH